MYHLSNLYKLYHNTIWRTTRQPQCLHRLHKPISFRLKRTRSRSGTGSHNAGPCFCLHATNGDQIIGHRWPPLSRSVRNSCLATSCWLWSSWRQSGRDMGTIVTWLEEFGKDYQNGWEKCEEQWGFVLKRVDWEIPNKLSAGFYPAHTTAFSNSKDEQS